VTCGICGALLVQPVGGHHPRGYCSNAHRQAAYRHRRRRAPVVWPAGLEEAEERVVELIASAEVESWRAVEQLALAWRPAA
jgi:hypothetical protein